MRLHRAIDIADRMRPNNVELNEKISCLWRLECEFAEMMGEEFPDWTDGAEDPELLIGAPHDQVYPMNLLPFIDHMQEEMDLYQVDAMAANQVLNDVTSMYRRSNQANTAKIKGVFI